jgi:hypothetical protein
MALPSVSLPAILLPMYEPQHPHIPTPPTKKLKLLTGLSFGAFMVFALLLIVLCLQLITQRTIVKEKVGMIDQMATVIQKQQDEITKTKRELIVQNLLPPFDSFSQQCPGSNQDDGLFTPLSKTPIESYNVFLVDCRTNITTGKSLPRVVIFRVNSDGSKELTYGATAQEPLCITNKLPVANKLADKLSLPICQTN